MSTRLRRMEPTDLDRVMELEPVLFGVGAWPRGVYEEEVARHDRRYVVVVVDGVVVGYAGISLAPESLVMTVGVDPAYRRRGLGAMLLADLIDAARGVDAESIVLEVRAEDAVAQHLYASFGFEPLGIRRGYYQKEGADALVMRLPLRPPAPGVGPVGAVPDKE